MERDGKDDRDDGFEEREISGTGGGDVDGARAPENGRTETRAGARDADAGDAATPREDEGAEDATGGDAEGEGVEKDEGVGVKPKKPPNQSRENRRVRQYRSASDITQEELSSCFHLPSEAACRKLGVGLTVLKRQCRKYGIKRWPFRKMKSLDRLITNVQAGISPGDQSKLMVKSVEELEEQKRKMEECAVLDLDDTTKRLQQAYSKANHKARRNRGDATRIRAQATANAIRRIERSRGGSFYDPESVSDSLIALQRQLVSDEDGEASPDGTSEAATAANTPGGAASKDGSPAKVLLSNTPVDATFKEEANDDDDANDTGKKSAKVTSNVMVKRDGATARDYAETTEKVLTAVKGAWSPARPARRTDAQDDAEAFLSPAGKIRGSVALKKDLEDVAAWNVPLPKPRGRGRPPGPAKRGRKRKTEDIDDDDPLASLAAAALDSMGTTKPSDRGAGRGRPSASGDKDGKGGKLPAVSKFKSSAPAVTEDHPAFGLAPAVKGARSGAQSRLSQVIRNDLQNLLMDRLSKGKNALCEAFKIDPSDFDRYFNPKLQAASLAGAIEKLATKTSTAPKDFRVRDRDRRDRRDRRASEEA